MVTIALYVVSVISIIGRLGCRSSSGPCVYYSVLLDDLLEGQVLIKSQASLGFELQLS